MNHLVTGKESYAIANTFMNFINLKNPDTYSLKNIVSKENTYSFGVSPAHFQYFMGIYKMGKGNSKFAMEAAINALIGGPIILTELFYGMGETLLINPFR